MSERRAILIVLDSLGAGAMPDACDYDDEGAFTINHIAENMPEWKIPNLNKLGFSKIEGVNVPDTESQEISGAYGRAAEKSAGKDTITGHWEIAGLVTDVPFQTFTDTGFPKEFITTFEKKIGVGVLGNYSASGTEIIEQLGAEHKSTGKPIVYTSADSVFQIAANTAVIPLERLYEMCEEARKLLQGDWLVGRVIARPFTEENGVYTRTSDRKDYSVSPPAPTMLDFISRSGKKVKAIGKISDIFNGAGITDSVHTTDNQNGIDETINAVKNMKDSGLIFTNLVDFDSKYGHRRDPKGYGRAVEEFDARLPEILNSMNDNDILILCADHGNDPTYKGWNHTREYVPVLVCGKKVKAGINLGTLNSFADIGAAVCEYLGVQNDFHGESFLSRILI